MMASTKSLLFTLLFLFILTAGAAQAASITVDGTNCTLADAITAANTDTAAGNCPAGSGTDTITLQVDVTLAAALPQITTAITIEGGGHFISGNNAYRVLEVNSGGNLTVNNATIKNGWTTSNGGGINNNGTLTLTNSTVSGNTAKYGGGICNNISIRSMLTLINSTISGNTTQSGGGIHSNGPVTLRSSIVSGNRGSSGKEVCKASSGAINAASFNVFGHSGETSAEAFDGFTPGASDAVATSDGGTPTALSAILSPLANNGCPMQTHALPAGSPAIDIEIQGATAAQSPQISGVRPVRPARAAMPGRMSSAMPPPARTT